MEKTDLLMDEAQKSLLLESVVMSDYDALIRINPMTGLAATVFASDLMWKKTMALPFRYEEVLRNYLLDASIDPEPLRVLDSMGIEQMQAQLAKEKECRVYFTVHGNDGAFLVKKASCYSSDDGFLFLSIKDVSTDVQTVADNMEQLRSALMEAKQEIREKNSFLSMVDQHLRTPLYSIMGLTSIAEDHPAPHAFDDYIRKISMSGSYMQETIDDLLSLRQIASHQIVQNPVAIDLGDFLSNIERMIRPAIYEKGLLFEMDASNVKSLQIVADMRCLQQIVMKMLRSTIVYAVRGGRIRLLPRVLYHDEQNISLELSVENRGIVIDRERLNLLFQPYNYLRERLGGSLGDLDIALIILRSHLLAMGTGTITAESDTSKGTRISVSLSVPLYSNADQKSGPRKTIPDFDGKRVLIVDDNEISLEVSEKILVNKGIQVVKARNGKEAVDAFTAAGGKFDLILMDVLMPVMNGLDAARAIRSMTDLPAAATIPIIALTVNAFRENFEESLEAGMNAHMVKPVDPDRLYHVLMEYIR